MYAKTFWNRVKALIKGRNVTQEITAKECGINFNTWRGWGSKNIVPNVVDCIKIAKYLDVSLDFMLTGKERNSQAKIMYLKSLLEKTIAKLNTLK
jgi:transcriptional regulator with XRE-family HTH domain